MSMRTVYFYDGTKNGFLCAFTSAFKDADARIASLHTQLLLGETPVFVQTNEEKANKVANRLLSFDKNCLHDLETLLRSGNENREQIAYNYLHVIAEHKKPIRNLFVIPAVFEAVTCIKKIGLEIHHFHGFVRFMETQSGALYAPISPDNDICDLLLPHFKARLPEYPFVLHDVKRGKSAVYDGKNAFTAPLKRADVLLSANELEWQSLWKEYYHAVNIPERERLRQMRAYMPKRYWKFMPEKNP